MALHATKSMWSKFVIKTKCKIRATPKNICKPTSLNWLSNTIYSLGKRWATLDESETVSPILSIERLLWDSVPASSYFREGDDQDVEPCIFMFLSNLQIVSEIPILLELLQVKFFFWKFPNNLGKF